MAEVTKITDHDSSVVTINSWHQLRTFTSARIALGRAGSSIPTSELLNFQLDHAKARDAVHCALDIEKLMQELAQSHVLNGATSSVAESVCSKASDRLTYLQRPDLGRQLHPSCWEKLTKHLKGRAERYDLAIVIADGLSSTAIQKHALPVTEKLVALLGDDPSHHWTLAPITVVSQGRVAIGDDIGECLNAKMVLILIGERPGLTSPDSMGMYMTWNPKRGAKESSRNCISNVRPEGLGYQEAAQKAAYLLTESMKLKLSGIGLKDRTISEQDNLLPEESGQSNFLLSYHTL